ncbi:LOW QUALITY PROTEIN: ubiquitin carboxyl-terminal hydrolase 16-like [Lampetra planeri]
MTKKTRKTKGGVDPAKATEDGKAGAACSHVNKALEQTAVRRCLDKGGALGVCAVCPPAPAGSSEDPQDGDEESPLTPVWLCLKCGHQGCGRYSEGQHALAHYGTPHSDQHCLALNLHTWSVWCYACDDEVEIAKRRVLAQTVAMIRKLAAPVSQARGSAAAVTEVGGQEGAGSPSPPPRGPGAGPLPRAAVRGLSNLGNTCFFNAVTQSLAQTPLLATALRDTSGGALLTVQPPSLGALSLTLGPAGPLSSSLLQVLSAMRGLGSGALNPSGLFGELCRRCPRFKGFQQQDSQELLRCLLDGVKAEDVARIKTAILEALDKPTSKTADEATRRSVKGYGLHAVRLNAVDRVFGGELINIITCDRCRTIVRVAEPFLDLSLPVIDNTASRPTSKKARAVEEEVEERGGRERGEDKVTGSRRRGSSPTLPPAPQSKFQEKKAKKQARQQAKSMRRQQKHQRKLFPMGAETLNGDPDSSTTDTTVTNNIKQEDENDIHVDNESAADAAATADDQDDDDDGDADDAADAADEDAAAADEDGAAADEDAAVIEAPNLADSQRTRRTVDSQRPERPGHEPPGVVTRSSMCAVMAQLGNLQLRDGDGGEGGEAREEDDGYGEKGEREVMERLQEAGDDGGGSGCGPAVSPEDVRISVDEVTKVEEEEEDDEEEEPMKSSSRDTRMRRRKDEALSFGSDEETRLVAVAVHDPVETLAEACDVPPDRASLLGCLLRFTTPEQLAGSNMLLCEHCSQKAGKKGRVYTEGTKRILVSSLPPVLTLHLKRFQQAGFGLQKVNRRVEFEDTLDMAPFCIKPCQAACGGRAGPPGRGEKYSLYAVVEHSGTMRGGHYTAYVKTRPERPQWPAAGPGESGGSGQQQQQEGAWFYVSDSHVRAASLEQVLACQAYLLFYERAGQ